MVMRVMGIGGEPYQLYFVKHVHGIIGESNYREQYELIPSLLDGNAFSAVRKNKEVTHEEEYLDWIGVVPSGFDSSKNSSFPLGWIGEVPCGFDSDEKSQAPLKVPPEGEPPNSTSVSEQYEKYIYRIYLTGQELWLEV